MGNARAEARQATAERRSRSRHTRSVIEQLVNQIEGRFAELERQMSDPEVIADRERYAEVGREYRELEPAHRLAREYAQLSDDLEGAQELLAEDGDDAELRKLVADAPGRLEELGERDPPGDGRARPQRLQERARRDPRRDRGRRGGAVRRRPLQDADPLRGAARLRDRGPRRSRRPRSAASRR